MRLPSTTTEIVIWVLMAALTLSFGGFLFFIRRYISTNDEHHSSVNKKLGLLAEEVEENGKRVSSAVSQINEKAAEIKMAALNFQKEIHKELHEVHKATTSVVADVRSIQSTCMDMQTTVMKQQESLSLGARAIAKNREDIDRIKTVVTKLSSDVTLISQTKKKDG